MHSKRIREKVKEDYDAIAKTFSETRKKAWPEFDVFKAYLSPGLEVLDLGCGNGRLSAFLQEAQVQSYLGLDQSVELLRMAQKNHPQEAFILGDMANFSDLLSAHVPDNPSKKYDAIFMIASFHHLPKENQLHVLNQVYDRLKPGGFLFMTNWNLFQASFWKAWVKMLISRPYGWKGLPILWQNQVERFYYAFSPKELRKLFREAHLELLEMQVGRNFVSICKKNVLQP